MLRKIFNRHPDSRVATCEICGKRGGSSHVPFKVEYWPEENSGHGGNITYRCKDHEPNDNEDLSSVEVDNRN
jgi:hypothetical protein